MASAQFQPLPHSDESRKRIFELGDDTAYQRWRDAKLAGYPTSLDQLLVELADPRQPSQAEHDKILELCRKTNMALYVGTSGNDPDKAIIRSLGQSFGLERLDNHMCADNDAISSLTVQEDALHLGYIPYSNRPISWHTDGYYNSLDHQIQGLMLHCVQPADEGGENDLLDHEILYILLRDENPAYIEALMHPQAMTIPANVENGEEIRAAQSGPVFTVHADGHLHMRYTARTRSIEWRDDATTIAATEAITRLLQTPSPWHFHGKLAAGQGLICNNVLHTRTGFKDHDHNRLLYRARYYDRIHGT